MTGSWWTSADRVAIPAGLRVAGRAPLPGSKSLTHRGCALALVARAPVELMGALDAEDTRLFFDVLRALGFEVERREDRVAIAPTGRAVPEAELAVGNAGTLFRFLVALVSTLPGVWTIDGVERLRERPIGPLADALADLGVEIDWLGRTGYAPLVVHGGTLIGGATWLDAGESSQYLSALLLAGQRAARAVEIEVPRLASAPYVDLTVDLLLAHGGTVERPSETLWRTEPSALSGGRIEIEPDLSAAAYPAAAAVLTGGEILLERVRLDSRQGDRRLVELLARMGARVEQEGDGVRVAAGATLTAIDEDLSDIPDQVPTLAALAPFARGTTRIRNVAHLRLKESDRLAAMAAGLRRAGAEVEVLEDGLVIPGIWADGATPLRPVAIDPHEDHRIAMAMALVGLRRPNLSIDDPAVVEKSWPDFFAALASWTGERR
jgi:3-phosphoshikimate 1-carboxyvinyltransferase